MSSFLFLWDIIRFVPNFLTKLLFLLLFHKVRNINAQHVNVHINLLWYFSTTIWLLIYFFRWEWIIFFASMKCSGLLFIFLLSIFCYILLFFNFDYQISFWYFVNKLYSLKHALTISFRLIYIFDLV